MIDASAPVEFFDEIDTTILEAQRRVGRGETGPVWLAAKRQSAGRGRRGRAWRSLEGNLHVTYLAAADRPVAELALLGFAAGVAIAETLEAHIGGGRTTLKWPNDVLIDGAKCAGILLDSGSAPGAPAWLALSFGVNLAAAPQALDQPAISLRDALPEGLAAPAPLDFLAALQPRLEHWDRRLQREGFEPLRAVWRERAHGLGALARVMQGEAAVEGRIVGLSPRGELELETAAGLRLIAAGELMLPNPG